MRVGRLEGWRVGGLEGWMVGRLEGWRVGGLDGWMVRCLRACVDGGRRQKTEGQKLKVLTISRS